MAPTYYFAELLRLSSTSRLRILKGPTIGLLGLAFKPETDDRRDGRSLFSGRAGRPQSLATPTA